MNLSEVDLAAVGIRRLGPMYSEYWVEVPCADGRVDLVGRDSDGDLHAVEFKTSASLSLAAQLCDRVEGEAFRTVIGVIPLSPPRQKYAHVLTENTAVLSEDLLSVARAVGFGIATLNYPNPPSKFYPGPREIGFKLWVAPRILVTCSSSVAQVSRALNDIHREVSAEAGGQSSRYWTPWKQGVHDLEQLVVKRPGITCKDAAADYSLAKSLYWQSKPGQVRKLAEASDKIELKWTHGKYLLYPKQASPTPQWAVSTLG